MTAPFARLTIVLAGVLLYTSGPSQPVAGAPPAPVALQAAANPLEPQPVPPTPLEVLPVATRADIPRAKLQSAGVFSAANPLEHVPPRQFPVQVPPPLPQPLPQPLPKPPEAAPPAKPAEAAEPKPLVPAWVLPAPDPQDPAKGEPLQPAEVLPAPNPQADAARSQLLPEDRSIRSLTANIAPQAGKMPQDIAAERFDERFDAFAVRPWEGQMYFWDAPDFCHRPLYFEQVNLERYGYTHCRALAPLASTAHFLTSAVGLPYNMAVHPRRECMYPLGYYRPGSPVPYQYEWPELQAKAVAVEAAAVTGLIFFIP